MIVKLQTVPRPGASCGLLKQATSGSAAGKAGRQHPRLLDARGGEELLLCFWKVQRTQRVKLAEGASSLLYVKAVPLTAHVHLSVFVRTCKGLLHRWPRQSAARMRQPVKHCTTASRPIYLCPGTCRTRRCSWPSSGTCTTRSPMCALANPIH